MAGAIAAGALLAPLAACGTPAVEEVESRSVVAVTTATAQVGAITGTVHATGVVTPSPGAELLVIAPEAARIADIPRAAGDAVKKGDVLVRFEVPSATADLERQQAEVARTTAALETATAAKTRAADLFAKGIAARREVEESTRAAAEAGAALAQARAALAAAGTVAARATVRATFDGVVARRSHNPGDLVEGSASDPVLRVIDPRRLEVVAAAPLADAARIRVGAAAHVTGGAIGAGDLALKVVAGPVAVEPGSATVPVRLAPAGVMRLPAGTPVDVAIEAERHATAILVPAAAIVRDGEETSVFVAVSGKAKKRAVTLGLAEGDRVEIVSGVTAGDAVIVDGQAGLPDDAAVSATAAGDGAK
jgi:RND family efflux transporter MFP subunit